MRLSCLQEDMVRGLGIVSRAVAGHSILPVLHNVMLSTDKGRLKLSATNLEISIVCWVSADVEEEGAITVPAKVITELVNSLPAERIDMEVVKDTLKLACGRHRSNLKGISAEEFPIIPEMGEGDGFVLPSDLFLSLARSASVSAASDEDRPVLNGVLVQIIGDHLTMASADGFRLSECESVLPCKMEFISVIVPAISLLEVVRVSSGDTIRIVLSESRAIFGMNDVNVISQLIEGQFPDYRQIIPKECATQATVIVKDLKRACVTTRIFARDAAEIARVTIGEDTLALTARSEIGDNRAEIDAVVSGEGLTFAVNVKYLLEMLSVIRSEHVIIETTTATSPAVFRTDSGLERHVIMPMHVSERV